MASKHTTSQDLSFQYYIDTVKQKKIPWNVFVKFMEDLSYSDVNRLKHLNAILLTELTVSHSVMERLVYLNVILMTKFKDSIQIEDNADELSENEHFDVFQTSSDDDHDLNDPNDQKISSDSEIHKSVESENEGQDDDFDSPIIQIEDNFELNKNEHCEVSQISSVEFDSNDQNVKEISSDIKIQKSIESKEDEREEDLDLPINEESKYDLKKHCKGKKDHRCDSCDKSFSRLYTLEKHLHTVHDGFNDHKCEFCGKSFTQAPSLKKHICKIHNGHKNHK